MMMQIMRAWSAKALFGLANPPVADKWQRSAAFKDAIKENGRSHAIQVLLSNG